MSSQSYLAFEHVIQDAINLLDRFDDINKRPPPDNAEVSRIDHYGRLQDSLNHTL